MRSPAVMAALAVSAEWRKRQKQRCVLQRLVRDVVAASRTEVEVLAFLEGIRQQMRPDLPPLDVQIDTMLAQSGMKACSGAGQRPVINATGTALE